MIEQHLHAWQELRDQLQAFLALFAQPLTQLDPLFSQLELLQRAQASLPPTPEELHPDAQAETVNAVRDLAEESLQLNRRIQEQLIQHMHSWEQDGRLDERRRRTLEAYTYQTALPRFIDRHS